MTFFFSGPSLYCAVGLDDIFIESNASHSGWIYVHFPLSMPALTKIHKVLRKDSGVFEMN